MGREKALTGGGPGIDLAAVRQVRFL
jgi:hypothetical protein